MPRVRSATATVVRVTDGDTFHANLDIGWGIVLLPRMQPRPGVGTVRVLFPGGVSYDAPESATRHGREAALVAQRLAPVGTELEIVSYSLDAFGRTLASVTLPDGSDWATVMTGYGFVKHAP